MKRIALPRLGLIVMSLILILGLNQNNTARGSDFENQGTSAVHRLFFVANGYVYTATADTAARDKATQVALRFGMAQSQAYLAQRGLSTSDYRITKFGEGHSIKILSSEFIDASFQGEGLMAVRIVAEIQYEFSLAPRSLPEILHAELASDRKQYLAGQHLYFAVRSNMKAHGSLLDLNPVGELIQLLPNGSRQQSTFAANVPYLFPDRKSGDNFDLVVGSPFGTEHIRIIVSNTPLPAILDESIYGEGFGVIERDMAWVDKQLRSQIVRLLKQKPAEETFYCLQVYENSVELTTSQSGYGQ